MRFPRSLLLLLLAFAPAIALAQVPEVLVEAGEHAFIAHTAGFGTPIQVGEEIGPLPLLRAEPLEACEPLENAAEVGGNIVLISRGECAFVLKVTHASEAGAAAVIIYNNDQANPDQYVLMGGECEPEVCTAPAASVTYNQGQVLLEEVELGSEATIISPGDPLPPPLAHNTGVMRLAIYYHGFIGHSPYFELAPLPFIFDGVDGGLFVSSVLVGIEGKVSTNPYGQAPPEFETITYPQAITPPAPFDQAFETSYESVELGVLVTQRSYSRDGDPYVIVELEVENVSGSDIEDAYVGIFADWDIISDEPGPGDSLDDFGGVNENLNVPYVYDADMDQYYGVAAWISDDLSGYSLDATTADDAQLWEALTTAVPPAEDPANRAAVTGTGPYDIAAGTSVTVRFVFVGGASEAEFFANATPPLMPSTEPSASADGFALAPFYPNPTWAHSTVRLDLPTAQAVRVAVFDVLGRRVAVLHDGPLGAGMHRLRLDAAALPAGVYVVRATAGSERITRKLIVVR